MIVRPRRSFGPCALLGERIGTRGRLMKVRYLLILGAAAALAMSGCANAATVATTDASNISVPVTEETIQPTSSTATSNGNNLADLRGNGAIYIEPESRSVVAEDFGEMVALSGDEVDLHLPRGFSVANIRRRALLERDGEQVALEVSRRGAGLWPLLSSGAALDLLAVHAKEAVGAGVPPVTADYRVSRPNQDERMVTLWQGQHYDVVAFASFSESPEGVVGELELVESPEGVRISTDGWRIVAEHIELGADVDGSWVRSFGIVLAPTTPFSDSDDLFRGERLEDVFRMTPTRMSEHGYQGDGAVATVITYDLESSRLVRELTSDLESEFGIRWKSNVRSDRSAYG